jgi:uncharacterized membrane protein HdeD (DUF308 family)
MADEILPNWIRYVDTIVGLITFFTGLIIIIDPTLARFTIILILIISLFAVGLARVTRAAAIKSIGKGRQTINLISGFIILAIVFVLFFTPTIPLNQNEMILLIAIAWIITALARILVAIFDQEMSRYLFYIQIFIGLSTLPIGLWIILYSSGNVDLLLLLLGIAALANGLARTSRGYAGV